MSMKCPRCGSSGPHTIYQVTPGILSFWSKVHYVVECDCGFAAQEADSPREAEANWHWLTDRHEGPGEERRNDDANHAIRPPKRSCGSAHDR